VKRTLWIFAAVLVFAYARQARAGNGLHARTPVLWHDVECLERIDRATQPTYALSYDIPFEDIDVTEDEVDNSRTHQFFAFCRQLPPGVEPPQWITPLDVSQAEAHNLLPEGGVGELDVLEDHPQWQGCWYRINADEERRPITYEMAEQEVVWDLAEVPAGTYSLQGYTYEPAFNLWVPRNAGVIKIVDSEGVADAGPAAAITSGEQSVCVGESIVLEGCFDALPDASVTVSYAVVSDADELQWVEVEHEGALGDGRFALRWTAPDDLGDETVVTRIDFIDPNANSYSAFAAHDVFVRPRSSPGCGSSPDPCGDGKGCSGTSAEPPDTGDGGVSTGATPSEPLDSTGTGAAEPSALEVSGAGCECRFHGNRTAWGWAALALFGLGTCTRRRARISRAG
jgi:hypothetical protein